MRASGRGAAKIDSVSGVGPGGHDINSRRRQVHRSAPEVRKIRQQVGLIRSRHREDVRRIERSGRVGDGVSRDCVIAGGTDGQNALATSDVDRVFEGLTIKWRAIAVAGYPDIDTA